MSTTIEAWAVERHARQPRRGRRLPVERAAAAALQSAGLDASDVDLLLNVGLHHRDNLGEPAYAAILQEDIGANPENPHAGGHGTFSFDIANGACGPLTALDIADGFLRSGAVEQVLVLAGDVRPGARLAPGYRFAATAAAMVVGRGGTAGGWDLLGTGWERSDEPALWTSQVSFDGHRNVLAVQEDPEFAARAALVATKAALVVLADHGLRAEQVDLVVAAPHRRAFADGLATGLTIDADRIAMSVDTPGAHTADVLVALDDSARDGRLTGARHVLLVAAGAGITAGAALLQRPN